MLDPSHTKNVSTVAQLERVQILGELNLRRKKKKEDRLYSFLAIFEVP